MQETEIWPYEQMDYAQPSSPGEWHTQTPMGLWHKTDHLISARRPDLRVIDTKKRTCKIVDFSVPGDRRIKLKESEKKYKNLDFARKLKSMEQEDDNYTNRDWYIWYSN